MSDDFGYSLNMEVSEEFAEYIKGITPPEKKYIIVDYKDGQPVYAELIGVIPATDVAVIDETNQIVWRFDEPLHNNTQG